MKPRYVLTCLPLIGSLSACGDGRRSSGRVEDSAAGTVALGLGLPETYRVGPVADAASLAGTIVGATAAAPSDTTDTAPSAEPDSGTPNGGEDATAKAGMTPNGQAAGADTNVNARDGTRAARGCDGQPIPVSANPSANVLVWIEGITAGKPLPELRRERLTVSDCRMTPRITAVVSGSTVNVFSDDPLVHEMRFYRENRGEPVARLLTVDEGQVIPSERIAADAGIVEARCTRHPWLRAYIAVFDHPYFAISDETGAFRIDSLPAGTYTVKMWREGMAEPIGRRVVVAPGGTGRVDLRLDGA